MPAVDPKSVSTRAVNAALAVLDAARRLKVRGDKGAAADVFNFEASILFELARELREEKR